MNTMSKGYFFRILFQTKPNVKFPEIKEYGENVIKWNTETQTRIKLCSNQTQTVNFLIRTIGRHEYVNFVLYLE
jgi:hypothetical protein